MELVKNIFFNTDKLIENVPVKISYTGNLFQANTENVYLHYGFGSNWENLGDVKMEKTELGFQSEIQLLSNTTLNFCFKNDNDEWDNNNGENYVFEIEPAPVPLTTRTDLIVVNTSLSTKRNLSRMYILNKKIKLAIYKIVTYIPKIISGNYRRKVIE